MEDPIFEGGSLEIIHVHNVFILNDIHNIAMNGLKYSSS